MVHAAVYLESGWNKQHLRAPEITTIVEPILEIFGAGFKIKGFNNLYTTDLALGISGRDGLPSHVLDRQCKESVA